MAVTAKDLIHAALKEYRELGAAELSQLTGIDLSYACEVVKHMFNDGMVLRFGPTGHYTYRLSPSGKRKRIKAEVILKRASFHAPRSRNNRVCDECRKNWSGYQIHKIFGSARA